jgi:hypothetical protein
MRAIARCMICEAPCLADSYWVCRQCLDDYPELKTSVSEWPEWARQLKRDHERLRRAERRDAERMLNYAGLDLDGDIPYPSERGDSAIDAAWSALDEWGYRDYNDVCND